MTRGIEFVLKELDFKSPAKHPINLTVPDNEIIN